MEPCVQRKKKATLKIDSKGMESTGITFTCMIVITCPTARRTHILEWRCLFFTQLPPASVVVQLIFRVYLTSHSPDHSPFFPMSRPVCFCHQWCSRGWTYQQSCDHHTWRNHSIQKLTQEGATIWLWTGFVQLGRRITRKGFSFCNFAITKPVVRVRACIVVEMGSHLAEKVPVEPQNSFLNQWSPKVIVWFRRNHFCTCENPVSPQRHTYLDVGRNPAPAPCPLQTQGRWCDCKRCEAFGARVSGSNFPNQQWNSDFQWNRLNTRTHEPNLHEHFWTLNLGGSSGGGLLPHNAEASPQNQWTPSKSPATAIVVQSDKPILEDLTAWTSLFFTSFGMFPSEWLQDVSPPRRISNITSMDTLVSGRIHHKFPLIKRQVAQEWLERFSRFFPVRWHRIWKTPFSNSCFPTHFGRDNSLGQRRTEMRRWASVSSAQFFVKSAEPKRHSSKHSPTHLEEANVLCARLVSFGPAGASKNFKNAPSTSALNREVLYQVHFL